MDETEPARAASVMTSPAPTPVVSVIIATYNYGHFLDETLESVAAQTLVDWECLIADDGSTDDTEAIVKARMGADDRFRYLPLQHRGLGATRNSALAAVRGRYIQILDSDDLLEREKLRLHAGYLDEHTDVDIVYSLVTFFRTSDPSRVLHSLYGKLSRSIMAPVADGAEALRKLEHYNIMPPPAALSRRSVFERIGGFTERAGGVADWDAWLRAAIAGCSFRYLPTPSALVRMRTHETSMSRDTEKMLRDLIAAAKTFPQSAPTLGWPHERLPWIYEVAAGTRDVEEGRRWKGMKRLFGAAFGATERISGVRWLAYAVSALFLPRRLVVRFVAWPIPEEALEVMRRITGFFARKERHRPIASSD